MNAIQADTSFMLIARQLQQNNQQWEAALQQRGGSAFTAAQLREDVDYLKETLEKVHPGLYWYTDKTTLESEFRTVGNSLKKQNTELEFQHLISPLIEKIHCGHTVVLPSMAKAENQKLHAKQFPLDLYLSGDTALVKTTHENIRKGDRVLSINGCAIPQIVGQLKASIAADGFNQTYKNFLLNHQFATLFARHFAGRDTLAITLADASGQLKRLTVGATTQNEQESTQIEDATLLVYDSLRTALLTIPSLATEQDLPSFLEESFEQMARRELKNLIIDLRNNQGGRDEYGQLLYSYLAREPFTYYRHISVATADTAVLNRLAFGEVPFSQAIPDYSAAIRQENGTYLYTTHASLGMHQPRAKAFGGNVYILINGGTFSSAAEFAAIAHSTRRATFIGEETGGGYYGNCSLGTPTLTLPNSKLRITIPVGKYQLAVSESLPAGHGVMPHYRVDYSAQDVLQKKDKELDVCLSIIRKDTKQ